MNDLSKVNTSRLKIDEIREDVLNTGRTNCLTEIPQDIKLELVDGTLRLKAGSKVYVPNGAGKFDVVTIQSDRSLSPTGLNRQDMFCFRPNGNAFNYNTPNRFYSGSVAPSGSQYMTWYDTDNNLVKATGDGGSTWISGYSLPIGLFTSTSKIDSIDQIFNGFGYIGSEKFILPNVKGLAANGKNADGSLKNIGWINSKVRFKTTGGTVSYRDIINATDWWNNDNYVESETEPSNPAVGNWWYKPSENKSYRYDGSSWINHVATLSGESNTSSGVITSFTPKLPFRAVDYNDFKKLDDETVKNSGSKTINGFTTFNDNIRLNAQGGVEGAEVLWRTGSNSVLQDTHVSQDMYGNVMRFFAKNSAGTFLHPLNLDFETGLATTTTHTVCAAEDDKIATTRWVNRSAFNQFKNVTDISSGYVTPHVGFIVARATGNNRSPYVDFNGHRVFASNWDASYGSPDNIYIPVASNVTITFGGLSTIKFFYNNAL